MTKRLAFGLVLILTSTSMIGAAPGAGVAMAVSRDPVTFDPHGPLDPSAPVLLGYLYDTLLFQDSDGSILPYLAESWEVSDEGDAITFHLRSDVWFSNGERLDADSVIYTFERLKRIGFRSYIYGEIENVSSFDRVDDFTVRFRLASPSSTILSALTYTYAAILDPYAVEAAGSGYGLSPVGSGPFMLESWESQNHLVFVRNPRYAGHRPLEESPGPMDIETMRVVFAPSEATRVSALLAGEIDIAYLTSASLANRATGDQRIRAMDDEARGLVFLGFNLERPPFDDLAVRRAVAQAIDKKQLLDLAVGGLGVVTSTPIPPSIFGYNPSLESEAPAFDPAAAKRAVETAGAAGRTIRILTSNFPTYQTMATIVQASVAAIGLKGEIEVLDFGAMTAKANRGEYDLVLTRYSWNDPDLLRIYLGSESIGNRYGYRSPELDRLVEAGRREFDPTKRFSIYTEAQRVVMRDLPWVPLHMAITKVVVNDRIAAVRVVNNHVILDNAVVTE